MDRQALRAEVAHRCPQVAPEVLDDFFEQMDDDYFTLFTAPQIAAHVQLVPAIDDQHPLRVRVVPRSAASAEILLVGYDLAGEFALITGVMAACGLNIRAGQVFSYKRGPERLTPWGGHTRGGLIVDLFTVDYDADRPFDAGAQEAFATCLTTLIQLQRQGKQQQARDTLNYRLINAIRASGHSLPGRLFPVEVRIDNSASPDWTVVYVTAEDTPGFLYSLSNALAMRGFYVHRVNIRSVQGRVQDDLCLGWRHGGKITSDEGQQELRFIVVLIKQFTHFLTAAPDPATALQHFDQFLDRLASNTSLGDNLDWLREDGNMQALATMLGSSDFLWEDFLRMQHVNLLPVLKEMQATDQPVDAAALRQRLREALRPADAPAARKVALNTFKDREMFRIDLRHLQRPDLPFGVFADELTDLAEVVVDGALEAAQTALGERYGQPLRDDGAPCPFALFALGKFGGRELGYASDIEMLCVYGGSGATSGPQRLANTQYATLLVQHLRDLIVARQSGIFEIDLRLRPHGDQGPLATSWEVFKAYYSAAGQAADFERQALIKLRWVAGDAGLGRRVEAWRDGYVYSGAPFDLKGAAALRERQIAELVTPGRIDSKYSRGGLVDVEYTVQVLQLRHGVSLPKLRIPSTLRAIKALRDGGVLHDSAATQLAEAYRFLRRLIDAQRIVRGHARDLVLPPPESDEFLFLARRLGYWEEEDASARLTADITAHRRRAARLYAGVFQIADVERKVI
jgi:glutamate-ammonia-ligase adenylyltransferase